ncbi:MAG TPA: DUF3857 domain-containing protein, partial [Verrucomicrobiae bacterium]|nr:DUF3857 domain-containing protein [Verrucomicrobiae bacterium]
DTVLQRVLVSTVPTWQDVSRWYWDLSKPHLDMTTPEMKQTVSNLTAHATTDLDKVKAIFYFVSKSIRYMGLTPEKDRPGFEPHDVCITFQKKYGVCRDKAGLLVEMLRLAGFDAYPVLINVGAKRDMKVPRPDFNHAIACVELKKGEYTLMDPTDENTRDLLPTYDGNRSYLVCSPEGETLRVSPVQPPDENMLLVKTSGTLKPDGSLDAMSDLSFEGVNDDQYRNAFAHMKPDDLKRFFEARLKSAIPSVRLTSLKIAPENVLDTSVPLHAELKFTATGLAANGGSKSMISLPWISKNLGIANLTLTGLADLQKRKYPLLTEIACGVREDVSLRLADGFAAPVATPDLSSVDQPSIGYDTHAAVTNGMLTCSRDFKLKSVEFSPEQYLELKRMLKDISYDSRKSLIMALKSEVQPEPGAFKARSDEPVESDATILESRKSLDVKDAHTATYRVKYSKRIMTYAGKIRESEVKLPFNPACGQAKIVHAVVISKTGERQEISPGEINVMDQGWNASARRYTGGKVLVASLPGVEIGSTIEVEFETSMHDRPSLSGFEAFQFPDALDEKTFELTAPANLQIHKLVTGAPGVVAEKHNSAEGTQTFQWHASHTKPLPSEAQVPPEWVYEAGTEYFVGDAHAYWQSLNDAMLAHSRQSAKATTLAQQLTAGAKSKRAAVVAIRDFIASNIRNAGPSFTTLPLRELSDADTTLSDGYGHAADRAILYYAMLSAAGFKPEFVMASDLPPIAAITNTTQSFPLPDHFQTPLVRVSMEGEPCYLNDTDQYARLGTTGNDDQLGLVLSNQKIETIQAEKNFADKSETDYVVSLSDDGKARIKISKHYYGTDYNQKHKFFAELPPEERQRYYQEVVSQVAQGAKAVDDLKTDFGTYPGLEEFTVDLDDYGVVNGNYLYFNLPFTHPFFAAMTDQRSLPYYISFDHEKVARAEIEFPAGYVQTDIVPKSETFKLPGGSRIQITKSNAPNRCVLWNDFHVAPAIINPTNYPELLDIQSALGQKSATTFLLEKEPTTVTERP